MITANCARILGIKFNASSETEDDENIQFSYSKPVTADGIEFKIYHDTAHDVVD